VFKVVFTKKAVNDISFLKAAKLDSKAKALIELIKEDPFAVPPSFEKPQGIFKGAYSRRINIKHRLVYEIIESDNIIKIISLWSHYEF
jgi:Txe/YoeB family toxin of toxin-antitoxin system